MRRGASPRGFQLLLAILLFCLVITIVRYAPLAGLSAAPGSFSGANAFRYNQAIELGHDPSTTIPTYSPFDAGVNPSRGELLYTKLQVKNRSQALMAAVTHGLLTYADAA